MSFNVNNHLILFKYYTFKSPKPNLQLFWLVLWLLALSKWLIKNLDSLTIFEYVDEINLLCSDNYSFHAFHASFLDRLSLSWICNAKVISSLIAYLFPIFLHNLWDNILHYKICWTKTVGRSPRVCQFCSIMK